MMDISEVKQFLGPTLQMATVFDAFSRVPLMLQVFDQTPDGPDMARLLRAAARAFGRPKYLITDKGGQFVAGAFRKAARRLGAQHRFAATDSILATARLERFWRLPAPRGPPRSHTRRGLPRHDARAPRGRRTAAREAGRGTGAGALRDRLPRPREAALSSPQARRIAERRQPAANPARVSEGRGLLAQPSERLRTRLPGSISSTSARRFTPGGASGATSNSHCRPSSSPRLGIPRAVRKV